MANSFFPKREVPKGGKKPKMFLLEDHSPLSPAENEPKIFKIFSALFFLRRAFQEPPPPPLFFSGNHGTKGDKVRSSPSPPSSLPLSRRNFKAPKLPRSQFIVHISFSSHRPSPDSSSELENSPTAFKREKLDPRVLHSSQ